jgi:hypothetical protein
MCDTDMPDAAGFDASNGQDSVPQLTPRTLFPGLGGGKRGLVHLGASAGQGSGKGGFSSKLVGSSAQVPNLATFLSKPHAVADCGK